METSEGIELNLREAHPRSSLQKAFTRWKSHSHNCPRNFKSCQQCCRFVFTQYTEETSCTVISNILSCFFWCIRSASSALAVRVLQLVLVVADSWRHLSRIYKAVSALSLEPQLSCSSLACRRVARSFSYVLKTDSKHIGICRLSN